MPTIFTHAVVPLLLGAALPRTAVSWRLLATGAVCAMLPDADSLSFQFNVPSGTLFAHRGITHSIGFALLIAGIAALVAPKLKSSRGVAAWFVGLATLSHPLLDMLTNGGSGVALWFPLSAERVRFAWRPVLVAPISVERFLSARGVQVLWSEMRWLWLPAVLIAFVVFAVQKRRFARSYSNDQ